MPEIDDGMIDGKVDPTASSGVAPSARTAGVEITAPPTPNMPERMPVSDTDEQRADELQHVGHKRRTL